jgi:hypothetical protein
LRAEAFFFLSFFTGQLPYLTHGHHSVAPLFSIVKYVAALAPASVPPVAEADAPEPAFSADVDMLLGPSERARRTAWISHIESALGDLVVRWPSPALEFQFVVVIYGFCRPMHSTLYPRTMPGLRIPLYLPFIVPHNRITFLAASARCTRLGSRPPGYALPLRRNPRSRSRSILGWRRKKRTTRSKRLKMHSNASGWVARAVLEVELALTLSDCNRSWKSRARHSVSMQGC